MASTAKTVAHAVVFAVLSSTKMHFCLDNLLISANKVA